MKKYYIGIFTLLLSINTFSQQPYYSGITTELTTETGMTLFGTLATLTANNHTNSLTYSNIWDACKITDEDPNNASNVLLIYGWENGSDSDVTNDLSRSKNSNGGSNGQWNREHTFANSLANPSLDNSGTSGPPYADAQNLRAADVQRNGQRGSLKFVTGSGNSHNTGSGWYPGDATAGGVDWRGDVARITMYMYLRYGSQCLPKYNAIGTTNSVDADMINLLLDWNAADPPSAYEDARNTYHDSSGTFAQGNRNPFIDEPYLATLIWGGTPAQDRWGIYGGSSDTQAPSVPTNLAVSNETSTTIDLNWTASTDNVAVTGYDIYIGGVYNSSSATNSHTVTGLTASTTYSFTVLAKDLANNMSVQSSSVDGTTTAGGGGGSGSNCVTETFSNIPTGQSSYNTRTWTGDDGGTWTATFARTDQTINGPAITVRAGALTSPSSSGGIGDLTVTTQLVFSGSAGNFDLLVNGSNVGTIPYSSTQTTTTINNINVEGAVTVVMDKSGSSNRVIIDDLSWTCYSTLGLDSFSISDVKFYPNPVAGNTLNISTNQDLNVQVFNILGKQVLTDKISTNNTKIDVSSLKTGVYLIRLSSEDGSVTKKLIKQ